MIRPNDTITIKTELVEPNDTNILGNLHGGKLMYWMDICSAMAATKLSRCPCVTASVDNVSFQRTIKLGEVVSIKAFVSRTFRTSIEVYIEVFAENMLTGQSDKSNQAFYTFVALDAEGKPTPVPEIFPESEKEVKLFEGALRRRQIRLVLAGKMKAQDANELKEFLFQEGK